MAFRLCAALGVAIVVATSWSAPSVRAGEGEEGLGARAERLEREGKALLEAGKRVEGAKTIAESWRLRAELFAREARGEAERRVEELRARSADVEKEAHRLRDAGKPEDAEKRIQEAAALWKEAEALAASLRAKVEAGADREPLARKQKELERRLVELQQKRKDAEAKAADLWADGKEAAAQELLTAAKRAADEAAEVQRAAAQLAEAARAAADPAARKAKDAAQAGGDALRREVDRLRAEVAELRGLVKALRERVEGTTPTK
ncbi:MAG: hypothetical protein IT460_01830 [Planctomycetes bacterium]|nr:hypothetical protein [Planctomycetota bacterium]